MGTDAEIAWAAGIFEGEGCISIKPPQERRHLPSIRLVIQTTDEDVLVRFREIVGCGSVVHLRRPALPGKKAVYSWELGNRVEVESLVLAFLPWLGERRTAKAQLVLDDIASLDRNCLGCGAPFRAYRSDAHWCSHKHRMAWHMRQYRAAERFIKAVI